VLTILSLCGFGSWDHGFVMILYRSEDLGYLRLVALCVCLLYIRCNKLVMLHLELCVIRAGGSVLDWLYWSNADHVGLYLLLCPF